MENRTGAERVDARRGYPSVEGDNRDPLNYIGITLLSIVGKVYTRVLSDRVAQFAERSGGIVEEQGGFRPGRGSCLHSRRYCTVEVRSVHRCEEGIRYSLEGWAVEETVGRGSERQGVASD